jgi:hypothetical protein
MTAPATDLTAADRRPASDARFGWWSSLATALSTLITFAIAVATPPMSGPWCQAGCYAYPYLDVAPRFPRDYYWMFPAIVAQLLFAAFLVALQARARPERRLLAQFGVVLGAMAALTIAGDYFVQLAVVQPSLLAGEADGVSMLSQFNPHGVFIALEELGYLLTTASLACLGLAQPGASRLEKAVRWLFGGGFAVGVGTLLWYLVRHGHQRAYFFEIAIISIAWLTLIPGAFLMTGVFGREARRASEPGSPG